MTEVQIRYDRLLGQYIALVDKKEVARSENLDEISRRLRAEFSSAETISQQIEQQNQQTISS